MNNLSKQKVLITDDVHPHLIQGLKALSYEIDYQPSIGYSDIFGIINKYQGVIINSKVRMTRELLGLSPKLKFIGRLGSGLEIIDIPAAEEQGTKVFSAPEGNRNAVAEHTLGMLLALANNLVWADIDVRKFHWDRELHRGFEIENKTVGIVGFGNNGSQFAKKLAGLEVNVLAYDKYKVNYANEFPYVQEVNLEKLLKESDIISLHVPLDTSTHFMIDRKLISKCKDGVIIVNSSRGKVIKTMDLLAGLKSGKISGACLDVFENEKTSTFSEGEQLMYGELYKLKQVILSPHVAGWTVESKYKIADSLLQQISKISIKA